MLIFFRLLYIFHFILDLYIFFKMKKARRDCECLSIPPFFMFILLFYCSLFSSTVVHPFSFAGFVHCDCCLAGGYLQRSNSRLQTIALAVVS